MNIDKTKTETEIIQEKLSTGLTATQVIAQGHKRSTVYQVARQSPGPESDEIAELKAKKAILKLKADIKDIESEGEKVPARIAKLERQITILAEKLDDSVNSLAGAIMGIVELSIPYQGTEAEKKEILSRNYTKWKHFFSFTDAIKEA